MSETIVEEYSGSATRSSENVSGDTEHMRIILVKENGETEELFRGKAFNAVVFQDRMKKYNQKSYIDSIVKKEDGSYELRM